MGAGVFVPSLNLSVPFWILQSLAPQGQGSSQNPSSLAGWKPPLPLPVWGGLAKSGEPGQVGWT